MKIGGGGVVYGAPRATALPTLLLGCGRARLHCSASSSFPSKPWVFYTRLIVNEVYVLVLDHRLLYNVYKLVSISLHIVLNT